MTDLTVPQTLLHPLKAKAEGGKVVVVESGIDCDCVRYSGVCWESPATVVAVERLGRQILDNAEGRVYMQVVSPSEAAQIEYYTRDLVLEAFENGRQHSIYV